MQEERPRLNDKEEILKLRGGEDLRAHVERFTWAEGGVFRWVGKSDIQSSRF